jgi:SNF2 family DNA or RNA helicase
LQPHQQAIRDQASEQPIRKLLFHSLGSGKSLSGIGAADAAGLPYTAIAPASLRANYKKEINKFTGQSGNNVMSYSQLASGQPLPGDQSLIMDEAQALRNPGTLVSQRAFDAADKAKQVILLSGSPIVNRPGDLASPLRLLTGENMSPDEFEARYVTKRKVYPTLIHRALGLSRGEEWQIDREAELRKKFKNHVHYYDRGKPIVPVEQEDIHVPMSNEQNRVHQQIWGELPWWVRVNLSRSDLLSDAELRRTVAFISGPRQVGLSTLPFTRTKDPIRAFSRSTKLQEAHRRLTQELQDPRRKALVFSNYIDAGLVPYSAGLSAAGIPHAIFHGGLNDKSRKKLVDDYNDGKIRVALLGPSGTEGLSFKGTQLVQLLDPHWHPVRQQQSIGRALRYDSHADLPAELQRVKVQRFFSRIPATLSDRLASYLGMNREQNTYAADDRLRLLSDQKRQLNQRFSDFLRSVGS